ncbi:MAG: nitronate monooxygenase [Candidatus Firestonebacteria bacterium]
MENLCSGGLNIGGLLAKVPIIQGGMGVCISLSGLASAVANEGGIGVIATPGIAMRDPEMDAKFLETNNKCLAEEIRKAKKATKGIIGVNIMMALSNFSELVKTSIAEGVDVIFSGAGLPMDLPDYLKGSKKTKLVPIVSSERAAKIIMKRWKDRYSYTPDGFVVEGPKAGGHLGFRPEDIFNDDFTLEKLVVNVLGEVKKFEKENNVKIPVIAGGGIFTGEDIHKFLKLGASGVQMATRFVTTHECDASEKFKEMYLNCKEEDIIIVKSPVGMPGRVIRNEFINAVNKGLKQPFSCPYKCIITCDVVNAPYCIAKSLVNAAYGKLDDGFAFAGANAYRCKKMYSVRELIDELMSECKAAAEKDK